jgi:uncharacterized protein
MSRRRFLVATAATTLAVATAGSVSEPYRFTIEHVSLSLPHLRSPLRAAFLTDLHYGTWIGPGSVEAWVDATNGLRPDAIFIGGDIVDHHGRADLGPLLASLTRLQAPLGVYGVWGNHEYARFDDDLRGFRRRLQDAGVTVLVNEGVPLRDDVYLAGVDDLRRGVADIRAAVRARPPSSACVLLSHNPDLLPDVPVNVGVTLCGHTHGGQVRLPGIGPVVTSSRYGARFAAGWVRGPALGYVSRGLGVTFAPVRFNCPAELTLIEFDAA